MSSLSFYIIRVYTYPVQRKQTCVYYCLLKNSLPSLNFRHGIGSTGGGVVGSVLYLADLISLAYLAKLHKQPEAHR